MKNALRPPSPPPCPGLAVAPWDSSSAAIHELLEALDDAMFAAIAGDAEALQRARLLWATALRELPRAVVDESREQYLRRAAEATQPAGDEVRDPTEAIAALEVLEILAAA